MGIQAAIDDDVDGWAVGGEHTAVNSVTLVNITLNLPYILRLYSFYGQ